MIRTAERTRRVVALATMVVVSVLTVGVPLLDRGGDQGGTVIAAEHVAGTYADHDHGICVQHGASAWAPGTETTPPIDIADDEAPAECYGTAVPERPAPTLRNSRAPPVI